MIVRKLSGCTIPRPSEDSTEPERSTRPGGSLLCIIQAQFGRLVSVAVRRQGGFNMANPRRFKVLSAYTDDPARSSWEDGPPGWLAWVEANCKTREDVIRVLRQAL